MLIEIFMWYWKFDVEGDYVFGGLVNDFFVNLLDVVV